MLGTNGFVRERFAAGPPDEHLVEHAADLFVARSG
jgi:hypothetical protein